MLDIACYIGLQWLGLDHRLARVVSFWPAATWNWFLNRKVTFHERPPDRRVHQWARFVAGSLAGLAVNAGSYALLTTFVAYFIDRRWLAMLFGVALGGLLNFVLAARYVYRRGSRPPSKPRRTDCENLAIQQRLLTPSAPERFGVRKIH